MGMETSNYIIVGTRIPLKKYEKRFGHPYLMDEKDNDLVAVWGGEKDWDTVVVGKVIENMDTYAGMGARTPTDLMSARANQLEEVKTALKGVGIEDREVSVYLVGQVL